MDREDVIGEMEQLREGIERLRKQADELEVAIRRNEGAFLQCQRWLEKMDQEDRDQEEEAPCSQGAAQQGVEGAPTPQGGKAA